MGSSVHRPIAVDLYAGAGGLSLGLEQAGFDVLAAVEYDPIHAATHEYNFAYGATICADVRRVSGEQIRRQSPIGHREIDVVVGGPPCQGFSLIGKRALEDPRNQLVAEFGRLVTELNPRYFVMENVAGLTVGDHRQLLDELIAYMGDNGYSVLTPYRVLEAAEHGVPQGRRRVFLIGARGGLPLPSYPEPQFTPRTPRGGAKTGTLPLGTSVLDAIGDLPNADEYPELLTTDVVDSAKYGDGSAYSDLLRGLNDAAHYGHRRPWEIDSLTSSMRTEHTQVSIDRFSATRPGQVEPISRFLRLHPDGVCNTLRAGTASDRGAFTSPRPIHPLHPRCITVREAARLHSYPDWFRFHATKWHGFRQIGNSVPPLLGEAVAREVLAAMGAYPSAGREVGLGDPALLYLTQAEAADHYGVARDVIPPRRRPTP